MTLPSREELKEAVKALKGKVEGIKDLDVLLGLATAYISAEGLPEEMQTDNTGINAGDNHSMQCYGKGYNQALSQARLVVAKLKEEIAENERTPYNAELENKIAELEAQAKQIPSEEKIKEFLPDALAEAQVEIIPNSAMYDVNVGKLAHAIHALLAGNNSAENNKQEHTKLGGKE